jgi:hypothetical protein
MTSPCRHGPVTGRRAILARSLPWTPSLSYRYAAFSGDDPDTATFERFDPLYSGGLSEWLQGITINKALSQANRHTHRIRFNVAPDEALNLTFDWYLHTADTLNNLGGNPLFLSSDRGTWARSSVHRALGGQRQHLHPGRGLRCAARTGDRGRDGGSRETLDHGPGQLFWHF